MAQVVFNHVGAIHHSLMAHAMIIGRENEDISWFNQ
jgi:hypothetical protein